MNLPTPVRKFVNHVRFMNNVIASDLETSRIRRQTSEELSHHEQELKENGIVIINDYMSKEDCDTNRRLIEDFVKQFSTSTQLDNGTFIGFRSEISNDNADKGMIDIRFIDKSIEGLIFKDKISDIENIISKATSSKAEFVRLNAYVNVGVSGTRDYHVDTFRAHFKAFIYLTDVIDESYGPYSYIKKSNGFTLSKYLNIYRNSLLSNTHRIPDMPKYLNMKQAVHCIGPKGTLVISDQGGIHRGIPQEPGKKRIALVFNFLQK